MQIPWSVVCLVQTKRDEHTTSIDITPQFQYVIEKILSAKNEQHQSSCQTKIPMPFEDSTWANRSGQSFDNINISKTYFATHHHPLDMANLTQKLKIDPTQGCKWDTMNQHD
jgi:hypothetical protein